MKGEKNEEKNRHATQTRNNYFAYSSGFKIWFESQEWGKGD